ncbi:MAG: PKD domain-containing protein, partial [Candidatus Solibacter sp.]|nr:PKD domain-containing protein [Candidatus Solibacter sp.]
AVPEGTVYSANLTVKNMSTAEFTTKQYFVKIRTKTLEIEINVAIDEGLWYLHKTMTRTPTCGGLPCGYWSAGYAANSTASNAGVNVNAFEVNGHVENDPRGAENPYADDVARGLRYLFQNLSPYDVGSVTTPVGVIAADTNDNGKALYTGNWPYELGPVLDAIIASGAPNTVVGVASRDFVSGRAYKDVAKDIVDMFLYCQYPASPVGGGWYYSCKGYGDNSISQWAAIGLLAAAKADAAWGFTIPPKTYLWNRSWLTFSFNPGSGVFGYQGSGVSGWGPYAVTPSGMVQMVMDGMGRSSADYSGQCSTSGSTVTLLSGTPFTTAPTTAGNTIAISAIGYVTIGSITDANHLILTSGVGTVSNQLCWWGPRWKTAETYMRDNFPNNTAGGATLAPRAYLYGLFSFVKAMLLHDPSIQWLHSETAGVADLDWYSAQAANGDPSDGVARTLIGYQCQVGGSCAYPGAWSGPSYTDAHYPYTTAWSIIMLNRTIFSAGAPVAVATASPNPAVQGAIVTLTGSTSFHQDPGKTIVSWQWDGITVPGFSATGPIATTSFPSLGNYQVRLKVTDNVGTTAQTIVTVQVSIPPLPPTANAGGPYSFCPARTPWYLDGAASSVARTAGEPGAPNNFITKYAWDLTGGQSFVSPLGAQPDVTAFFTNKGTGTYLVQL